MGCGYYLLYSVINRNPAHLKRFLHHCRTIIYHWQYVCMYINHNWRYNSMNIELINQHKFYLQILQYVEYNTSRDYISPLFDIAQSIKKSPFLCIFAREDYGKSH